MAGEFEGETEKILDGLDTVGNTTKAVTKGFAIGSAVIAAVALFASFRETIAAEAEALATATSRRLQPVAINIADPKTFVGALIGGTVVFLFSSLAILAVGRTAGIVVQEVRRQFREKPGIMDYTEKPDYGPVIDICTGAALRELATPALLAVLMPVVVGFGLGAYALGGFLAATIVVGALMANFLSNAGGAWDNAKKYIEEGNHGGKGSDVHKAVVIGDTVGDPFKDTAGPAINPLIKVMNLVSLLILPAILSMADDGARYAIAAAALLVVLGGIVYSKRQATSFGDDPEPAAPAELSDVPGDDPASPLATIRTERLVPMISTSATRAAWELGPGDRDQLAGRVFAVVLEEQLAEFMSHEDGVRRGDEPEALHDYRIALRGHARCCQPAVTCIPPRSSSCCERSPSASPRRRRRCVTSTY